MKLGLILECPKQGTDHQVYEYVISKLCPTITLSITGCMNKKDLISKCGMIAKILLQDDSCDRAAIVWDAMPTWGGRPCRKNDKDAIGRSLKEAQVDLSRVKLICMEPELEGWLLADGRGLTAYKAKLCHPHPVQNCKRIILSAESNYAKKIISRYLGRRYNDMTDAIAIVKRLPDFDRVSRYHKSFARLKSYIDEMCV
jgi:hypothetical protein